MRNFAEGTKEIREISQKTTDFFQKTREISQEIRDTFSGM